MVIFTFGGGAPNQKLRDEVAGVAKEIAEATPHNHYETLELSCQDYGLTVPASSAIVCWFSSNKPLLDAAKDVFKTVSRKFSDAASAANLKLQDFLYSRRDAASRRPATPPEYPQDDAPAGSEEERLSKKRKLQTDVVAVIAKSKASKLLPFSFELPEEMPKAMLKVAPPHATPNFVASCYIVLEKAKNLPGSCMVAVSLTNFPRAPGDLSVNEVPYRGLRDGRLLLCQGGSKPKLRLTLPEEALSMKLWPPDLFNLSMLSGKAKAKAISECLLMPAVYALLLGVSTGLQKGLTVPTGS